MKKVYNTGFNTGLISMAIVGCTLQNVEGWAGYAIGIMAAIVVSFVGRIIADV